MERSRLIDVLGGLASLRIVTISIRMSVGSGCKGRCGSIPEGGSFYLGRVDVQAFGTVDRS